MSRSCTLFRVVLNMNKAPLPRRGPDPRRLWPGRITSPAMFRSLITHLLLALPLWCAGQDPRLYSKAAQTPDTPTVAAAGEVTVHEPEKVTDLMKAYNESRQPLKGYRVQVFLGDRTKAEEVRRQFMTRHTDTPAYLSYLAPNFRIRVGDLRTKLEAEKLRDVLREEYPGLYVVPDEIEMPRVPPATLEGAKSRP